MSSSFDTTDKQRRLLVMIGLFALGSLTLTRKELVGGVATTQGPAHRIPVKFNYEDCGGMNVTIDPNGVWSMTTDVSQGVRGWTWHPGPRSDITTYSKHYTTWQQINPNVTRLLAYPPIAPGSISSLIQSANASLVFYGSSHLREIYFALMRLEYGKELDGDLHRNITFLPSGNSANPTCDPGRSGFVTGLYGVDMDKCGVPARRVLTELSSQVALGFKTFLHTPDADEQFLDFLTSQQLRHPEILIVDVGIWGPRGNKLGGSAQTVWTLKQEWDYYLQWIQQSFPQSHIVIVHEKDPGVLQRLAQLDATTNPQQQVTILRKDTLLQKRPVAMPCGHGCAGPVTNTLAVHLMEWLERRKSATEARSVCT